MATLNAFKKSKPHFLLLTFVLYLPLTLAYANTDKEGEALFASCAACHSTKEGENKIGPSLFQVLDKKAGANNGFRYSSAIKNSGLTWNKDTLNVFLENPQKILPGNRMPYSGMSNDSDRLALINYLSSE
jgi:cytochrome c